MQAHFHTLKYLPATKKLSRERQSVFDDFVSEAAHRRQSEARALRSAIFRMNLGAVIAAILGPLGLGGGLWLAHEGRSMAGLSSVIGTIGTLLAVFLYRGRKNS